MSTATKMWFSTKYKIVNDWNLVYYDVDLLIRQSTAHWISNYTLELVLHWLIWKKNYLLHTCSSSASTPKLRIPRIVSRSSIDILTMDEFYCNFNKMMEYFFRFFDLLLFTQLKLKCSEPMFNRTLPISQWFAMCWNLTMRWWICVVNKFQMSSLPLFMKLTIQTKLTYSCDNNRQHNTQS